MQKDRLTKRQTKKDKHRKRAIQTNTQTVKKNRGWGAVRDIKFKL